MEYLIAYLIGLILITVLTVLAYWRGNPIIFMLAAAVAMMVGLYSPRALHVLNFANYGVTIGLALIMFSFLCIGLAFANMFKGPAAGEN